MTFQKTKITLKDKDNNPINILYLAASQIVDMFQRSIDEAGGDSTKQICMPIWIDQDKKMLITIETGPETESQFAIYKAKTQSLNQKGAAQ